MSVMILLPITLFGRMILLMPVVGMVLRPILLYILSLTAMIMHVRVIMLLPLMLTLMATLTVMMVTLRMVFMATNEYAMNVITKIQLWKAQSMLFGGEYLFPNDWAAIIRENFDKQPWNENSERFAIYSTTRHISAKGEWRVRNWLTRSNTLEKKYHNFTWAIKGFLRDGNPCKTQQFIT